MAPAPYRVRNRHYNATFATAITIAIHLTITNVITIEIQLSGLLHLPYIYPEEHTIRDHMSYSLNS